MAEDTDPATRLRDAPVAALDDLLRSVPRLVERTARQAALVRSAAGSLWCLGSRPSHPPAPPEPSGTDAMTAEPVSVLDLFDVDDPSDGTQLSDGTDTPTDDDMAAPAEQETFDGVAPPESELAVPDYDSLAASQVVPRLALLSAEDLRAVLAYEQVHRRRQTILNRVSQLLEA